MNLSRLLLPFFRIVLPACLLAIVLSGCGPKEPSVASAPAALKDVKARFTLLDPQHTGVTFVNKMQEDYDYNNFTFEYMYNGGGVAAGDVNGDGLPDLYFSSSRFSNKLYLNKGNFQFVDVTDASGVGAREGFKTGVAMYDVNGDGRLDIYSCRTSKSDDHLKTDHLFINMGNREMNGLQIPVFEDQAVKLGLDDNSNTNHCCFFDYDRDGDLDLFLLNHKLGFREANKLRIQQQPDGTTLRYTSPETPFESDRLFRNDGGKFVDVTAKAGVTSSAYGLSATAADLNGDGWLDLYVCNDYVEPDFIFINNRDGTFTDHFRDYLRHTSHSSMGADIADVNNDGLVDMMTLEMKPEDPIRYKELMNIMLYDRYNMMVQYGYGRQVNRNVLQLNNGNNTFSEIGQYAGVASTDWSWGVLLADYDNDGWNDMFISNGYRKDVSQLDYLNYFRDSIQRAGGVTSSLYPDINEFLKYLPEKKIRGYFFLNNHDLSFYDATVQAGMDQLSFSNGSAYADLDQDGDLDLIVNNIDEPAFIYRNDIAGEHWVQIQLQETGGNTQAIGANAQVYAGGAMQYQVVMANKGFFSSSERILHFGLGTSTMVDSIILHWPDGKAEIMTQVPADQRILWKPGQGSPYKAGRKANTDPLFSKAPAALSWMHQDDEFVDFKRERLMPYMVSAEGPCLAIGDINGDQLEDIYAGNGRGFPSAVLIQTSKGTFTSMPEEVLAREAAYEDCGAVLQDFDGDRDLDLVVASGGNALPVNDPGYVSRYYRNDGKGNFTRDGRFPLVTTNASCILSVDLDQDQDMDILIGGQCTPGRFPTPSKSYALINEKGSFTDATKALFPDLANLGMITDIEAGDLDGDGRAEIIIAGDWMPVRVFSFDGKQYQDKSTDFGVGQSAGWWKSLTVADIDMDGDLDILAGNMGTNNRFKASQEQPVTLVTNDFDGNGSLDPIMCYYYQDQLYPFAQRDAIIGQIPSLKKKFTRYNPYARATLQDVFSKDQLKKSTYLYTHTFKTTLYRNDQHKLVPVPLPYECQWSPVFDAIIRDINGDQRPDILMAGNFLYAETETSEMDAGNGVLLVQQTDGTFAYVPNREHGFWAQGEVRELKHIRLANGQNGVLIGNNKGSLTLQIENLSGHEQ